jgi:RNA polymerase-binding protein DksA
MSTVDLDLNEFRDLLEERRRHVVDAIERLQKENDAARDDESLEPAADNHPADAATSHVDREIGYTLEEDEEELLREIDAGLARIEDGTYGICVRCGKAIGEERLRALPHAALCIEDKRKEERG